jgi:hypothetical protein
VQPQSAASNDGPLEHTTKRAGFHVVRPLVNFFRRGSRNAHGKVFAVCPWIGSWERSPLPSVVCHGRFAVSKPAFAVCQPPIVLAMLMHGDCHVVSEMKHPWLIHWLYILLLYSASIRLSEVSLLVRRIRIKESKLKSHPICTQSRSTSSKNKNQKKVRREMRAF